MKAWMISLLTPFRQMSSIYNILMRINHSPLNLTKLQLLPLHFMLSRLLISFIDASRLQPLIRTPYMVLSLSPINSSSAQWSQLSHLTHPLLTSSSLTQQLNQNWWAPVFCLSIMIMFFHWPLQPTPFKNASIRGCMTSNSLAKRLPRTETIKISRFPNASAKAISTIHNCTKFHQSRSDYCSKDGEICPISIDRSKIPSRPTYSNIQG